MDTEHGLYRSPLAPHDPINSNPHDHSSRPGRPHSARRHKKEKVAPTTHPDAELLYDLFFLANLTVFTNVHSVNDTYTLKQYVGFFSLIWLTWYQVGLYDVRFCMDSVVECVARALQLGVMIGFAACGPQFNSGEVRNEYGNLIGGDPYRGLTLILMASRLILVFQYLQTIVLLREHKATRVPLVVLASIYAFATLIYFALFWSFKLDSSVVKNWSWVAWYVIGAFETLVATLVSALWKGMSIKGTQVIHRMGLLTLIILGEGAIGIARQCGVIIRSTTLRFDASVVGSIASAVLILYFIYMLHVSWTADPPQFSGRRQFMALLHFPLHMLLALAVEGISWCLIYRSADVANQSLNHFTAGINTLGHNQSSTDGEFAAFAESLNKTSYAINDDSLANARTAASAINVFNDRWIIDSAIPLINASDRTVAADATQMLYNMDYITTLTIAGFGKKSLDQAENDLGTTEFRLEDWYPSDQREAAEHGFWIVFVYTFASIGLVVLICTLMAALGKKQKNAFYWIRLAVGAAVGVFLCLFCLLAIGLPNSKDYDRFVSSPWVLPMIAASLLAVAILNNTSPMIPKTERRGRSRSRSSSSSSDGGRNYRDNQVNSQPVHNHEHHGLLPTDGKPEAADGQGQHEKTSSLPEQHQVV